MKRGAITSILCVFFLIGLVQIPLTIGVKSFWTGSTDPYFETKGPDQPIWDPYILTINNSYVAIRVPLFWLNISKTGDTWIGTETMSVHIKLGLKGYAYVIPQDRWVAGTVSDTVFRIDGNKSISATFIYTSGDNLTVALFPKKTSHIKILTTVIKGSAFSLWERFAIEFKFGDLPQRTRAVKLLWEFARWVFNFQDYEEYVYTKDYNPTYNNASIFVSYRMNSTLNERQWTVDPVISYSTGSTSPSVVPFEDYDFYESHEMDSESTPAWTSAGWNSRTTTTSATTTAYLGFRFHIPASITGDTLITRIKFYYADTTDLYARWRFIDADGNYLFTEYISIWEDNSWITIDFKDFSGYPKWFEFWHSTFTSALKYDSGTNLYEDKYWDGADWQDMNDLSFEVEYVADYGYCESFRDDGYPGSNGIVDDWSVQTATISTDGDVLTATAQAQGVNWLTGWDYRKKLTITGSSGAGTYYQIDLDVNYGSGTDSGNSVFLDSKCQTDFDDIRFTDDDGSTELDYWIEEKTDSDDATFWVEVTDDLDSNQEIYIYYGNTGASTTSNGFNTFLVFDDFEDGDTTGWSTDGSQGATVNFEADTTHVYEGTYSANLTLATMDRFGSAYQNISVEDYVIVAWLYGPSGGNLYDLHGLTVRFLDVGNEYEFVQWKEPDALRLRERVDGTGATLDENTTWSWSVGVWNQFEFRVDGTQLRGYVNGSEWCSVTDDTFSSGEPGIFNYMQETPLDAVWVDNVYVRKYTDTEPSCSSWGDEELEEISVSFYNYSVSMDSATYQFLSFNITEANATITTKIRHSGSTLVTVASGLTSGVHRYNLEEVYPGTIDGIVFMLVGSAYDYAKFDYCRIFRFFSWTSVATDGDKTELAYVDSEDLKVIVDSGKYINLTDDIGDFVLQNYPYCRLEVDSGTVRMVLLDSGDSELAYDDFTSAINTIQFTGSGTVDKVRLQIFGASTITIDFLTFSVMNITSSVTLNFNDTSRRIGINDSITSITASWGDGEPITSTNVKFDLEYDSTDLWINATNTSITSYEIQAGNYTYSVESSWCNDSRYRYWTPLAYEWWIEGTNMSVDFDYNWIVMDSSLYLGTYFQIEQATWYNDSVVSEQPTFNFWSNTTTKGYDVLTTTGWLPNYQFLISEPADAAWVQVWVNATIGDFWQTVYNVTINVPDLAYGIVFHIAQIFQSEDKITGFIEIEGGGYIRAFENETNLVLTTQSDGSFEWDKTPILGRTQVDVVCSRYSDFRSTVNVSTYYDVERILVYVRYYWSGDNTTSLLFTDFILYADGILMPDQPFFVDGSTVNFTVTDRLGNILISEPTFSLANVERGAALVKFELTFYRLTIVNEGYDPIKVELFLGSTEYPEEIYIPAGAEWGPIRIYNNTYTYTAYYWKVDVQQYTPFKENEEIEISGDYSLNLKHKSTVDIPDIPSGGIPPWVYWGGIIFITFLVVGAVGVLLAVIYLTRTPMRKIEERIAPKLSPSRYGGHLRRDRRTEETSPPSRYGGSRRKRKEKGE